MIEALKSDEIIEKVGGRFKLTALIQKRWLELMRNEGRPMVDPGSRQLLEVVIQEILEGKITIDYDASDITKPGKLS
jgi:DNA-directed RNA polymerase subunit omega